MALHVPEALRAQIQAGDRFRCAYCQTSAANSGIALTLDHIRPQSTGGLTVFANMCLACRTCNEFKADRMEALGSSDRITSAALPSKVASLVGPFRLEC